LKNIGIVIFAFVVFAVGGSLFHLLGFSYFRPDLLCIIVSYLSMRRDWTSGILISAICGTFFAFHHGTPAAFFIMDSIFIFFFMRLCLLRLNLRHLPFMAGFTFVSAIASQMFITLLLDLFYRTDQQMSPELIIRVLFVASATAVFAFPLMLLMQRLEEFLTPVVRDNYLLK